MYRHDTIVALATPPGRGAVAIVRLSGSDAFALADRMFRLRREGPERSSVLRRGTIYDPQTLAAIDDALSVRMCGPATYTGEDVVEFHTHGSPIIVEAVIAAAVSLGARPAEPGEYTRRAVLNGKMDLAQAEAVEDLVNAPIASAAKSAWGQLQGALSDRLAQIRAVLCGVLADVEANVDFVEEDLPEENPQVLLDTLADVRGSIESLLRGYPAARRLREGCRVAFAGRPNAGKSSIVNALLGHTRMIVSDEPGTTRDSVEELIDVGGSALVLTDTAGIRSTDSQAEAAAVAVTRAKLSEADIAVLVVDRSVPNGGEELAWLSYAADTPGVIVLNKADLADRLGDEARAILQGLGLPVVETSARTGLGCDELKRTLQRIMLDDLPIQEQPVGISRIRHREALAAGRRAVEAASALIRRCDGTELVAIELRDAINALASITEPLDNEEILDRIFASFCIGK